jgi:hypothetical protein
LVLPYLGHFRFRNLFSRLSSTAPWRLSVANSFLQAWFYRTTDTFGCKLFSSGLVLPYLRHFSVRNLFSRLGSTVPRALSVPKSFLQAWFYRTTDTFGSETFSPDLVLPYPGHFRLQTRFSRLSSTVPWTLSVANSFLQAWFYRTTDTFGSEIFSPGLVLPYPGHFRFRNLFSRVGSIVPWTPSVPKPFLQTWFYRTLDTFGCKLFFPGLVLPYHGHFRFRTLFSRLGSTVPRTLSGPKPFLQAWFYRTTDTFGSETFSPDLVLPYPGNFRFRNLFSRLGSTVPRALSVPKSFLQG